MVERRGFLEDEGGGGGGGKGGENILAANGIAGVELVLVQLSSGPLGKLFYACWCIPHDGKGARTVFDVGAAILQGVLAHWSSCWLALISLTSWSEKCWSTVTLKTTMRAETEHTLPAIGKYEWQDCADIAAVALQVAPA